MVYAYYYFEFGHELDRPIKQMLEADYPYTAKQGDCQWDESKGVGTVSTFETPGYDSKSMKASLA